MEPPEYNEYTDYREPTESTFSNVPRWARYTIAGMIALPTLEFMVIIGLIFWRLLFGVYEADHQLFVDAMNTFGSSFVNSIAFGAGAGGVFGMVRGLPKLLARIKS